MGNCVYLVKAKFAIPIARSGEALVAVTPIYEYVCGDTPETLSEVCERLAWPLVEKGDHLVMVDGDPPTSGWQHDLFEAVKPLVVAGSFVKAKDEQGERFEWVFSGHTIEIGHARIIVPVANLRTAFAAVEKKLPTMLAKLDDPSSVTAIFDRLGWKTVRMKDGSLHVAARSGELKELSERDRRVLKVLAPFVAPESVVESLHADWHMSFVGGRLQEHRT